MPRPRFLSSTVHGAFSLFAKERMGGALDQLASSCNPPRRSRAEREAEETRKFALRQEKRREKREGH